jgi:hypothetical protein
MTTYFPMPSNPQASFQFSPTLDGQQYTAIVTWNLEGQRYYLNLYDLSNNLITCRARVGSPGGFPLQSLSWSGGIVTATTVTPHGYPPASFVTLSITGAAPDGFNVQNAQCYVTGPSTFTYAVSTAPGAATMFGAASRDIDLVGGYFETSTMVFREGTQNFEVAP